jgi:SAM-dependent methyltransferase
MPETAAHAHGNVEPGAAGACRFCGSPLTLPFLDLGAQPPSNAYLAAADLERAEPHYPLRLHLCEGCFLVQLGQFQTPEQLFGEYAYFSSYSESWLAHASAFAESATRRFELDETNRVIEVASNDGYLLRPFASRGIPVLGIEPARNVARVAAANGIPTIARFFGARLAREVAAETGKARLLVGNNVLAHVPDLNDFVKGLRLLLAKDGVLSLEFPHLLRLIGETQFDTIYHEHFSYFSFLTVERILAAHGIVPFDVEEIPTHGGSLRLYAAHADAGRRANTAIAALRRKERAAGLDRVETYRGFPDRVREVKRKLLRFLIEAKDEGRTIVGYGAPAKGNTLLNYCGIGPDFLDYTVDRSPHKQGRFLPGSRIPIEPPKRVRETRPDYLLILPWNLETEIIEQMAFIREWGGRFVVPIPKTRVIP